MSLTVVYLPAAEDDIAAGHAEYESESPGLGDRFAQAVRTHVDKIAWMPEMYGEVAAGVRAAPVRKFPYVVYYRIDGQRAVILAVTHGRRHRQGWEQRV